MLREMKKFRRSRYLVSASFERLLNFGRCTISSQTIRDLKPVDLVLCS